MKQYYSIILLACYIISNACKSPTAKDSESEHISQTIARIALDERTNWVIILPGLGCKGCIQEGEMFMMDNIHHPTVKFLLTKTESLKIFQQKTRIDPRNHPNIILDRENKYDPPSGNAIYPCIVQVQNGKVLQYEFQAPSNAHAFLKLRDLLSNSQYEK